MNEAEVLTGRCLCCAVSFKSKSDKFSVVACHCDMCRRWSAGPFMALNCKEVEFDDEALIGRLRTSDWAERGYCKECGSNLFYHLVESSDYQIAAGLFDDQSGFRLSLQLFVDRKPDFYDFDSDSKK